MKTISSMSQNTGGIEQCYVIVFKLKNIQKCSVYILHKYISKKLLLYHWVKIKECVKNIPRKYWNV